MQPFEYAAPDTLEEASGLLANQWGDTEVMAGGTDLVTCLKQGLVKPKRVVSLKNVKENRGIEASGDSLRVGALVTLAELIADDTVQKEFPALVQAVNGIGARQMIAQGSVGGDLLQRPRCWYYRMGHGLFGTEDGVSLVTEGDNRYHAIFKTDGNALYVHPSSLAPALIALGATVEIHNGKKARKVAAADLFQIPQKESERESVLEPNEILTAIAIPRKGLKNGVYEVRHRHGLDWPYVAAAVAYEDQGGVVANPSVVLGHVAPIPWRSASAEKALDRQPPSESNAQKAGEAATEGASPLSRNAYKVALVKTAVKRAVLAASGQA